MTAGWRHEGWVNRDLLALGLFSQHCVYATRENGALQLFNAGTLDQLQQTGSTKATEVTYTIRSMHEIIHQFDVLTIQGAEPVEFAEAHKTKQAKKRKDRPETNYGNTWMNFMALSSSLPGHMRTCAHTSNV